MWRLVGIGCLIIVLGLAAVSMQATAQIVVKIPEKYEEFISDLLRGKIDAASSKIRERLVKAPDDEVLLYLQATIKSLPFYPQFNKAEALNILKKSAANDEAILPKYALLQLSYPVDITDPSKNGLITEELKDVVEKLNATEDLDNLSNYQIDILSKSNIYFEVDPDIVTRIYDFDHVLTEDHFAGFGYVAMEQIFNYGAAETSFSDRFIRVTELLSKEDKKGFPGARFELGMMLLESGKYKQHENYSWYLVFTDAFIGNTKALDYIDQNYADFGNAVLRNKYLSTFVKTVKKQDQSSLKFCKTTKIYLEEKCIVYSNVHDLECFNLQLSEEFNIPDFRRTKLYEDCRSFYLKNAALH